MMDDDVESGPAQRYVHDHPAVQNVNELHEEHRTFGDRVADGVAEVVGSWSFILTQTALLGMWIVLNVVLAAGWWMSEKPWDPYPFILLNLVLSFQAAYTGPIVMMSQNRQAAKDRLDAANDYKVNLKAEIEIMGLHDKLDQIRTMQLEMLLMKQQEQIDLLLKLVGDAPASGRS
jgi:uncharacterized membrane protein